MLMHPNMAWDIAKSMSTGPAGAFVRQTGSLLPSILRQVQNGVILHRRGAARQPPAGFDCNVGIVENVWNLASAADVKHPSYYPGEVVQTVRDIIHYMESRFSQGKPREAEGPPESGGVWTGPLGDVRTDLLASCVMVAHDLHSIAFADEEERLVREWSRLARAARPDPGGEIRPQTLEDNRP